ncbi:translocation/assembly module TamB domain-containing protein [Mucilaginibacter ginkgonis]|uniref:translocation/assembly module TamB domain-containing protein n=1 Tax=Mucilaginibacter ginkgonis TaxID=2682091 RepID=UPI001FC8CDB8|nr:translocation/assembly module TamB domain-containing protein [Mucilaginibacter ginkgonis]
MLLLMVSVFLLILQYKPVQTWAAKKATAYLSKELHTKIGIKSIYLVPFSSVVLEGFYVLDKQQDTLVSTPKLSVELNRFSIFSSITARTIHFENITLDNGSAYLKKQKDSTSNLQFIIDYFNNPAKPKTPSKPWTITFNRIGLNNFHFRYKNQLVHRVTPHEVNFADLDINHFTTVLHNIDVKNHIFKSRIEGFSLREKSGFLLQKLAANATIDSNRILLQDFHLKTGNSDLKNYLSMKFKSFDDFSDFENKILMDADIRSSFISSKDIAFFTSSLDKVQFDLGVSGHVSGKVNNLIAKNLQVTGGQATYVKGNFTLKGLPDWNSTHLNLDFDQLATNKKDLDYLIRRFSGDYKFALPEFLNKFGNINFTGRMNGLQENFQMVGTFKTKLGRFDPNLHITLKNVPTYAGKIKLFNFDVGAMLGEASLGRTTLAANINGSGDDLKNLNIKTDAKIDYLVFNKYQYHNIALNGQFINQAAKAVVKVNDRNIKLDLNGSIDLKPNLPVYTVNANVNEANLYRLKFLKDTVTVSTIFKVKISGNDLKNLQGVASFTPIRIVDPRHNYVVDSIEVKARGLGSNRMITLRSDLMDGTLTGTYDLATLPSYFKTIVKQYIPSLKTTIVKPGPQNFQFTLQLKNLDPFLTAFMPQLRIPERGTFTGQFNSATNQAVLNGYIKTLKYGKTVFHDFIIDESTNNDFLGVNLSLSKVDITDSLFIKNITVTNFLKKDSLDFNIKLSDKNAVNQLDLYGLVEFGRDTTAKLKLLPSDVILENQKWHLNNQVRIRLLNGKTQISGFELTNGEQKAKINGFISDSPEDELKLDFEKFRMSTLDQLTKAAGIKLSGTLNGEVVATAITGKPGVDAKLKIDSLKMNDTQVGNVAIASSLDNERNEADINMNILNRGLETMKIGGVYHLSGDNNTLDFDVKMNQTEAIIFSPFVKGLVSDLKGTISTNLKLTGTASKPALNGDLTLSNTGVKVDYLNTSYIINDKLDVKNSVIQIKNMQLTDGHRGKATANGTVDLNNLSNPNINVVLNTNKFLALNTTVKENSQYYGKAFATGRFSFAGPIDNMKIDIRARTEDSTVFNIPLNTSATAGDYDFIRFVAHKDSARVVPLTNSFNGVTLNFDLTADEKTVVRITTDYGQLEGRGITNNLKLNINSLGDFEIFGDYLISSGKFLFTAKNFISKLFQVNQGGTIRWTGDPANANIDMQAFYEVRTNINNLYTAAGLAAPTSKFELVQAELILTKSLLHPNIDFDFNFPTDPSVKDDVSQYLTDYNNRSQQALSIIVRRQFATGYGSNVTDQVKSTAQDAVSEVFFNQLNNVLSQNLKNVDLSFRSFSDASASVRLFKERLSLSGSLYNTASNNNIFGGGGTQALFNSNLNSYTKDFEADYLLRADGRLKARYSYRVLNSTTLSNLNNTGPIDVQYVNGVGLVYQRDFDSPGEFLKSLFTRRKRVSKAPANTPPPISRSDGSTTEPYDPNEEKNPL